MIGSRFSILSIKHLIYFCPKIFVVTRVQKHPSKWTLFVLFIDIKKRLQTSSKFNSNFKFDYLLSKYSSQIVRICSNPNTSYFLLVSPFVCAL